MGETNLSKEEKELLKFLVKKELELFKKEKSTITDNMSPKFIKSEELNEDFLEELIAKLK